MSRHLDVVTITGAEYDALLDERDRLLADKLDFDAITRENNKLRAALERIVAFTHHQRRTPYESWDMISIAREALNALKGMSAQHAPEGMPDGATAGQAGPTPAMRAAGGRVLWEKQFEGTPWAGKVHLIRPDSLAEYEEVAVKVWEAMCLYRPYQESDTSVLRPADETDEGRR